METKSLTILCEEVRKLTQNVGGMSEKITDIGTQIKSLKTIILSIAIPLGIGLILLILQNIFFVL